MIIITDNSFDFMPMIDVTEYDYLVNDIKDALYEYILSNQQRTVQDGEMIKAFYVSGLADFHHDRLKDYLNSTILRQQGLEVEMVRGSFADYPLSHSWLQLDNLLIDIALRQFANKETELYTGLRPFLESSAFISDNTQNFFYKLYQQV